ncbi:MAG TPA: hypothetical protein VFT88_05145 [Acidobacteriaceae bacterium]|nr:hypothetical protein [Acidobacteriaceae bacterium]
MKWLCSAIVLCGIALGALLGYDKALIDRTAPVCLSSHRELIVTEKVCRDGLCLVPIVVTVCDKAALTMPKGVQ